MFTLKIINKSKRQLKAKISSQKLQIFSSKIERIANKQSLKFRQQAKKQTAQQFIWSAI